MRKFAFGLMVTLLLALGIVAAVHAQEPVSAFDIEYNWCNSGEPWGDGRCTNLADPNMVYCHWQMGWYLPRVQAGEYRLEDVASPCMTIALVDGDCLTLIVVLQGSSYTGTGDINVGSDDFDGTTVNLGTYCGLEIHGNDNDNFLIGSAGGDVIYGYGGDDLIIGDDPFTDGSGNDTINGGDGDDFISGDSFCGDGSGNDTINGGDGDDYITGDSECGLGSGNDTIDGGAGSDVIVGDSTFNDGSGNDTITGGSEDDLIAGDSFFGTGSGDDTIDGGANTDSVDGPGNSDDTITNVELDVSTPDN